MVVTAALLLAFAPPANPIWSPFGTRTAAGNSWSIDKGSVARSGRRGSAWFKVDSAAGTQWNRTLIRDEVDCDTRQYRTLEAILYPTDGGTDTAAATDWRAARPGSAAEKEVDALCDPKGIR